ncbi:hypothetical protein CGZ93_05230 [Enemella dayhoffiae]|uniref:MaoC-like domain-containing protein n=1 Tax=Enemella dayhoffiae TaxID=2016507 RepID=A0A255H8C2_9ACTN|nr:MaoC/PaaZ C-terminal domain-containing protein [Enemella dayhoffiae]OYO23920.1 hypothetical protein CGZ93_05230 [Enemella dayhoffiae]
MNTSTVKVGDELTPMSWQTGLANWNRYAAVNDEFVPIHMDDEAGCEAGFDSAFGMGNLQWSYLHNVLRRWLGGSGRILKLSCQFRSPNTRGMTVTARGAVTAVDDSGDGRRVSLDVWTEDQAGRPLAKGAAEVLLD